MTSRTSVNPVEIVAALVSERDRLAAEVAILRERLELDPSELAEVSFMVAHHLTRQEAALLRRLIAANGLALNRYSLEASLPARDHAKDRRVQIVDVLLSHLRKKLGPNVIETVPGLGWRISPTWAGAQS